MFSSEIVAETAATGIATKVVASSLHDPKSTEIGSRWPVPALPMCLENSKVCDVARAVTCTSEVKGPAGDVAHGYQVAALALEAEYLEMPLKAEMFVFRLLSSGG